MIRLGVTGTDTGVGKTVVAAVALAALRHRGLRVAAMKPVETGAVRGPGDAVHLAAAAGGADPLEAVCPVVFREPLAPAVAAGREGRPVELATLDRALARLSEHRDAVVVEGAGGLLVPLTARVSYADLFARWRLDVLIVAANRLGAINHVLLTVHAAWAAGLVVRGLVLNTLRPDLPDLAQRTNLDALRQLLPRIPVLLWPWMPEPRDFLAALVRPETDELLAALGPMPGGLVASRTALDGNG